MDTACNLYYRCIAQRSNDDWDEFIRRYDRVLHQLIRQTLARYGIPLAKQDLEEYVQDLYLRLLTSRTRFHGHLDQELWLYLGCMARNMLIDHWRFLRRRRKAVGEPDGSLKNAYQVADPTPSPERRAILRQRLGRFLDGCRWAANGNQVELKLRVLRLVYVDGCSSREIAQHLNAPITATQVDSMLFRMRQRLAQRGVRIPHRQRARPLAVTSPPPFSRSLSEAPESFIHRQIEH